MAESCDHLVRLLAAHVPPPPPPTRAEAAGAPARMLPMGCPALVAGGAVLDAKGRVLPVACLCPRCGTAAGELPSACSVCTLPLVAAAQLARSEHHLAPLPPFLAAPSASAPSAPT